MGSVCGCGGTWQEMSPVPWGAPKACPQELPVLAESGALRNGTEEVLSLEQCPPTKRLKSSPCNNGKEQRAEEDQSRGESHGLGLVASSTGKPLGKGLALPEAMSF